jgi:exodeoxyribonuclease VII small subunit
MAEGKKSAAAEAGASFGEAMAELEAILRRVEGEEVDVDRLAEELRRAAELLELCRAKIKKAEIEVTQIVHDLEDEAGEEDEEGGDEEGDGGDEDDDEPEDDR